MSDALFTEDQIKLIRRTVAAGCNDDEFQQFMHMVKRVGLDPIARQIHAVKRQGKITIQVGIDGFRLVADRTGQYAGSDDAEFGPQNERNYPSSAKVVVYKMVQGQRCPFSATARWEEYFPGDAQGFQWKRMPFAMLAKCAESLALRKAFPADLSGLYSDEEMGQADRVLAEPTAPKDTNASPVDQQSGGEGASGGTPDGKNAFGYVPMQWPKPKQFSEPLTQPQAEKALAAATSRMIDMLDIPIVRRLVLAAYGLDDGDSKGHQSLWIDWLLNADEDALERASAAADAVPEPEVQP